MTPGHTVPQLTAEQRAVILAILERHLPHPQAWVFGSRATGRARPYSDLDILLTAPPRLSWDQRAQLVDAFDASELPFKVDLVNVDDLGAALSERVRGEMLPL